MKEKEKNNVFILSVFFTAFVLTSFFKISSNIVIPIFMEKFNISASYGGLISGVYYFSYAVLQILAGPLANKYGPHKVIGCSFLIAFAGSLCFAIASNELMVMLGRFLVGIGVGPVYICVLSFITSRYSGREFAMFAGLAITFSALGQVLGTTPLKFFINAFGIRPVFIVLAVLILVISCTLLISSRKKESISDSFENKSIWAQIKTTFFYVIKSPVLIAITSSWMLYNSIQHSYSGLWSTKWAEEAFPSARTFASLSGTLVSIGLMAGTFLSERLRGVNLSRTSATIRSEVLFALSTLLLPITHFISPIVCFVVDFFFGYCVGDICIQQTAYLREISEDSISPSIVGFMNSLSSLCSLLLQWLTGLSFDLFKTTGINDNAAFGSTFLILAALDAASAIWCISNQRKLRKQDK